MAGLGLGNLWRFAYLLGTHGGGPFMLAYVISLFALAVPVLLAEVVLGRQARGSPPHIWGAAARAAGAGRLWAGWALLACVAAVLMAVLYTVVGGWGLLYAWHAYSGSFAAASVQEVSAFLDALLAQPVRMLVWQGLILLLALPVLSAGVRYGLGVFAWLALPVLLLLLWPLIPFALELGDLRATSALLFSRHLEDFDLRALLAAMGHALFSLCIGTGVAISYGSYASPRLPAGRSVLAVALFDVAAAVTVSIVVMPLLLADGLQPAQGPGLLFLGLAHAFGNRAGGDLHGALFFLFSALLALCAVVALLEPVVSSISQRAACSRRRAAVLSVLLIGLLAAVAALSLHPGSSLAGFMPLLDSILSQWLLPLVALAVAGFVGWLLPEQCAREALNREGGLFFAAWLLLLRYVAPLGILVIWFDALSPV